MSNYTPPSIHCVDLDFKDLAIESTALNFSNNDVETASLETILNTAFTAEIHAQVYDFNAVDAVVLTHFDSFISCVIGDALTINTIINTGLNAEISAVVIDRFCSLESVIQTSFKSDSSARFDINFKRGVFGGDFYPFDLKAKVLSNAVGLVWADPYILAHQNGLQFEAGLNQGNQVFNTFNKGLNLHRIASAVFEQALSLKSGSKLAWQENQHTVITNSHVFEESKKLRIHAIFEWVELVHRNKTIQYSHEVAQVFEKRYQFATDQGLELITTDSILWDKAKSIHYRKHTIQPWPKPEEITPEGWNKKSVRLNFCCTTDEVDRFNANLDFEIDKCLLDPETPQIPEIENRNWWHIVNEVSIFNTRTNEEINVLSGSYGTDRSRWCWSYNLVVTESEMSKIEKHDVLKISVNGSVHMMLYEYYSKSEKFADTKYTLIGRSQSAFLGMDETPTRSYLQENERTSVQLAQVELDWVGSDTQLNWQLIDDLGWIVESESLSYTNQKPIEAIKMITDAGGGFVYSEKGSNQLTIKPLYKKTFWDSMQASDFDYLISESLTLSHNESYNDLPNYNAITLTNSRNGNVGQVKRKDTAGDIQLNPVSNPLFDVTSMGGFAKAQLAKAGRVEDHDFELPICEASPEQTPGDIFAFNGLWWGVVDAVNVEFDYSKVTQKIKVERTVNE